MNKLKSLALVALAAFGLSVHGATTTNEWWNVTFEDDSFQEGFVLEGDGLGTLTNMDDQVSGTVQPYASGLWLMVDGDESYVTNGLATNWVNNAMAETNTTYIKLDTQGNDLTWTPTNGVADNIIALVDADLLLVGSDSAPDANDFDLHEDVHTAIYLKNETDEGSGETTNSVLCVYVFDTSSLSGGNTWKELDGVSLEDNAWAHVQVIVDYAAEYPEVSVFVNGTQMHTRNGNPSDSDYWHWTAANRSATKEDAKLSSVAFRGTGAVDNFVGETQVVSSELARFQALVYLDEDTLLDELCQVTAVREIGKDSAQFTQFLWEEYDDNLDCSLYGLDRVEITNFVNQQVQTYSFDYDPDAGEIDPMPTTGPVAFSGGFFTVTADTAGAPGHATDGDVVTNTVVRIYFKSTRYNITFKPENGGDDIVTNVAAGATAYAPADPTLAGFTFQGWTNALDATDTTLYTAATMPAVTNIATYAAKYEAGASGDEHEGAKSQEGFIILVPTDEAANNRQLEFTDFDPAAGAGNATATISAAMLNPENATSVTLQLIYRTSLTGQDQYVNAVITDINTANGTATVTFPLPQEDTLFLMGFRNQTGVLDE